MRSIDELATEICTLAGHINAANHRFLVLIAEFDRRNGWSDSGTQSCAHWLNWKCGIAMGAAREKVRVARALENLPKISAAMASGTLSYSKAREITRVGNAADEDYLLMIAEHGTAAHVERLVRAYRRCQEAEELSREQRQQQNRRVSFRYDDDGSLILNCHLPAEAGALVHEGAGRRGRGLPSTKTFPLERQSRAVPFSERRADALARVAESFLAHDVLESPGTDRQQIVVHVAAETLRDRHRRLLRDRARPFDRRRDRATLRLRRQRRHADRRRGRRAAQRRPQDAHHLRAVAPVLNARDKGCRFPGCCNARYIDMHHIKHWANGGETKPSNLVSLCRFHHRAVHEGGSIEILDDGALRFVRPDGECVDGVAPGFTQPPGDWRQLPAGHARCTRWRGERMDFGLAVDVMIQKASASEGRSSGNVVVGGTAPR